MVEDALGSRRTIGIVLLKPGYEQDYLSLLGCDTLVERATRLLDLLEFHALERTSGRAGAAN